MQLELKQKPAHSVTSILRIERSCIRSNSAIWMYRERGVGEKSQRSNGQRAMENGKKHIRTIWNAYTTTSYASISLIIFIRSTSILSPVSTHFDFAIGRIEWVSLWKHSDKITQQ